MAEYKSQHFVPQIYLRNFSKDGKTIGCCFVDPEKKKFKLVNEASIRDEACKDYFYSKDPKLEQEFAKVEGDANIIIQRVLSSEKNAFEFEDEEFLKQYVLFQHLRTPFRANEYENMMNDLYHKVSRDDSANIKMRNKQIFVLQTFLPLIPAIVQPFRLIILENNTALPFITSPEPSIFFNPYQLNRHQNIYGFQTHGGMFYMPLSAKKAVLLYDPLAYRIRKHKLLCSLSDVSCLNRLIIHIIEVSNTHKIYYDNRTTDIKNMVSLMLENIVEGIKLSFIKERFYLFGIPKRHNRINDNKWMQYGKPLKIEDFKAFIKANSK